MEKYLGKLSGPLLDRIDLYVEVPPLEFDELSQRPQAESSAAIKARVDRARAIQAARFGPDGPACNSHMGPKERRISAPWTGRAPPSSRTPLTDGPHRPQL